MTRQTVNTRAVRLAVLAIELHGARLRKHVNTAALAERFGVNRRTIQRDMHDVIEVIKLLDEVKPKVRINRRRI